MKIVRKIIVVLIITALLISLSNRVVYGTWNVFSYPNRVFFDKYRYDNHGVIVVLSGDDRPKYEVSKKIDKLTGKRIFSKELDFIGHGKVVYLNLGNNRYLILGCGGGG